MQETIAQLSSYLLGIWRLRWLALGVASTLAIAGWIFVAQIPESYVATARIYVDTNSVLRPLMRGLTVTPNINERISMMSRTLLSRPNLERLARMTDLDLQVTNEAQKDGLIKRLESSISLSGTRDNTSLYSISVTDRDRETARRIAQALITVFIETSMSDKQDNSSGAQIFLKRQLAESEKRLIEAENRLAAFKQNNIEALPGELGDYYGRLQRAKGDLEKAQLQLRELENRQSELQRQLDGEDPVFIAAGSSASSPSYLDTRIQALQTQLDSLRTRYTNKHPEIRHLRALIDELEERKQADYAASRNNPDMFGGLASSPVYQGMRAMLAETQAQAAEVRVRVDEYQARVQNLRASVRHIPEVEAQLIQLTRDYEVVSQQHQQMLERREAARLSGDMEKNSSDVSFRVIDPPFVPLKPSEPNKPLLNSAALLLASGGGGALALLFALLNPIITDPRMLTHTTGLPLLGTVTHNSSPDEQRDSRRKLTLFFGGVGALLLIFAGVTVIPG